MELDEDDESEAEDETGDARVTEICFGRRAVRSEGGVESDGVSVGA